MVVASSLLRAKGAHSSGKAFIRSNTFLDGELFSKLGMD